MLVKIFNSIYILSLFKVPFKQLFVASLTVLKIQDGCQKWTTSSNVFLRRWLNLLDSRNRSAKHYRHRASPDCNTVASFDSSSSESRNGLNRYYRQAWENLHESAGSKAGLKGPNSSNHSPLKRKETLDEPYRNGERHRDGSELVVSETFNGNKASEKKRHHHHHHHHEARQQHKDGRDWREPKPPPHRDHKRY